METLISCTKGSGMVTESPTITPFPTATLQALTAIHVPLLSISMKGLRMNKNQDNAVSYSPT